MDKVCIREEFDELKNRNNVHIIPIEANPGQYDARQAAVESSLVLQTGEKYETRYRKVIVIEGDLSTEDLATIKNMLINTVEAYESDLNNKSFETKISEPKNYMVAEGFAKWGKEELKEFLKKEEFSMNLEDILHIQEYFQAEGRDPTMTELIVLDTYWSDHCRHTTFNTKIDEVKIEGDETLVQRVSAMNERFQQKSKELGRGGNTFMEMAQASLKFLRDDPEFGDREKRLDVSIEDNAASYKTKVKLEDGSEEDWVIMFKNETHNSPTQVEPFGGAATCLG